MFHRLATDPSLHVLCCPKPFLDVCVQWYQCVNGVKPVHAVMVPYIALHVGLDISRFGVIEPEIYALFMCHSGQVLRKYKGKGYLWVTGM